MAERLLDHSPYADELDIERESHEAGIARYRDLARQAVERGDAANLKPAERLLLHWFKIYTKAIANEKSLLTKGQRRDKKKAPYGPLLAQLDSPRLAVCAMHEALGHCIAEPDGVRSIVLVRAIGTAISGEIHYRIMRRKQDESWEALIHTHSRRITKQAVNRVARKYAVGKPWTIPQQVSVGAVLLKILVSLATLNALDEPCDPAFEVYLKRRGVRHYKYVRLTRRAADFIDEGHALRQGLRPRYQPMVVPPMAWTSSERGGYLELPVELIKRRTDARAGTQANVETVQEAVNALNSTPWQINKPVLQVMQQVADAGGDVAGVPPQADIPMPPWPADWDDEKLVKPWRKEAAKIRRRNIQRQADRVIFNCKVDVATRFVDRRPFYFPHQLDFRTRAYPLPLFLNHQGDDVCRGLLMFDTPRPVEGSARDWLRIHLANCCGLDKVPFEARTSWVRDNMATIRQWADHPLTYTGWMDQDKPWQALAASIAMTNSYFAQFIPVQMDGSNNALQHYGAMLRCEDTASMVNLVPTNEPADVYARVAEVAAEKVEQDAANGNAVAKSLLGWVDRKIVKQTVMTGPYGVTKVGARRQVYQHLRAAKFDDDALWEASKYLSQICLRANEKICVAAHRVMEWLSACGRLIANTGEPIRWATPLGVVVEQPYRRARHKTMATMFQTFSYAERDESCPVAVKRQVAGLAPNFVHSIDASHMMCTAIVCRDKGITFAGVHDSYWTHAASASQLAQILREQFVCLHEEPAHIALLRDMQERYPKVDFPDPPATGSFDVSAVMNSAYFFA